MFESEEIENETFGQAQQLCNILGYSLIEYLKAMDKQLETIRQEEIKVDLSTCIVSGLTLFYARALNEFLLHMPDDKAKEFLDSFKYVVSSSMDDWFVRVRKIRENSGEKE